MSGQSSIDEILLFIMRHGEAESLRIDDKSRQLTAIGREQAVTSSQWLVEHYCPEAQFDLALVSPYRRTRQTFDMITLDLNVQDCTICADITPDGDPRFAHDYIDALLDTAMRSGKAPQCFMIVSHMPFVSFFLDEVCSEPASALFATGSVAVVRYNLNTHKGELVSHFQGLL